MPFVPGFVAIVLPSICFDVPLAKQAYEPACAREQTSVELPISSASSWMPKLARLRLVFCVSLPPPPPVPSSLPSSQDPLRQTRPAEHCCVSSQLAPQPLSPRLPPLLPPLPAAGQPGRPGGQSTFSLHWSGAFWPGFAGGSPSISLLIVTLNGSFVVPRVPAASPLSSVRAKKYLMSPVVVTSSHGISPPKPLPIFFRSSDLYVFEPKGL